MQALVFQCHFSYLHTAPKAFISQLIITVTDPRMFSLQEKLCILIPLIEKHLAGDAATYTLYENSTITEAEKDS